MVFITPYCTLKGHPITTQVCDPLQSAYLTRACPFQDVGQFFFHFLPSCNAATIWTCSVRPSIMYILSPLISSGNCWTTSLSTSSHNSTPIFRCLHRPPSILLLLSQSLMLLSLLLLTSDPPCTGLFFLQNITSMSNMKQVSNLSPKWLMLFYVHNNWTPPPALLPRGIVKTNLDAIYK